MIIIAGEMEFDPQNAGRAHKGALEMAAETVKEAGCIRYRFWADLERPERLHVYEEWESEAHLAAHARSDHMKAWRALGAELGVKNRDIRKFETDGPQPLG